MAKEVVDEVRYVGELQCLCHCTAVRSTPSSMRPILWKTVLCVWLPITSQPLLFGDVQTLIYSLWLQNVGVHFPVIAEFAERNITATNSVTQASETRTSRIRCVKQGCGVVSVKNTCVSVKVQPVSVTITRRRNFGASSVVIVCSCRSMSHEHIWVWIYVYMLYMMCSFVGFVACSWWDEQKPKLATVTGTESLFWQWL